MKTRSILGWSMAAVACVYWWWSQNSPTPQRSDNRDVPLLTLTDNTTYLYGEDGQRISSLQARRTEYFDNGKGTSFIEPEITHYQEDSDVYIANAQKGFISDSRDRIELENSVIVQHLNGDQEIEKLSTEKITYFPLQSEISTSKPLVFTTVDSRTTATGALWRLLPNSLILEQNIRTHYETTTP